MKQIALFIALSFFLLAWGSSNRCNIGELQKFAFTVHDPTARHKAMMVWLDESSCRSEQLAGIWNSLAEWAGTADSAVLRSKVLDLYERAVEREKK